MAHLQADDSFSIDDNAPSIQNNYQQYQPISNAMSNILNAKSSQQIISIVEDGIVKYLVNGDVSGLTFLPQNVISALLQQKQLVNNFQNDLNLHNGSLGFQLQQVNEIQQNVVRQILEAQHKISFLSAKLNKQINEVQQKLEIVNDQINRNKISKKNIQSNIKLLAYAVGVGLEQEGDISNEQFYTIIDIISTKLKRVSSNQVDVDSFLSDKKVSSFLATDDDYQLLQKKVSLLAKQLNEVKLENAQLIHKNQKIMEKNQEIVNENIFYRTHIDQLQKKQHEIDVPKQFTYHKFVLSNEQELFLKNRPDFGNIMKDITQLNKQLNQILNVKVRKTQQLQNSQVEIPEQLKGIYEYFYSLVREIEELNKTSELIKTKQFLHQLIGLE